MRGVSTSVLVAAVAWFGCGRVSFDRLDDAAAEGAADAEVGMPLTCAPWGNLEHLAGPSSTVSDYGPSSGLAGLRLYLHSGRRGAGNDDLFIASRAGPADLFGAATLVDSLSDLAANDANISTTSDELVAAFESDRLPGARCVFLATRNDPDAAWDPPVRQDALCAASVVTGPHFSADGLRLYYTRTMLPSMQYGQLMMATRGNRTEPFVPGTDIGISVPAAGYPGLTRDELRIVFESGTPAELWEATRSDRTLPFAAAQPITDLNSAASEVDGEFGGNGKELYFGSDRAGGTGEMDLWHAERQCTPAL